MNCTEEKGGFAKEKRRIRTLGRLEKKEKMVWKGFLGNVGLAPSLFRKKKVATRTHPVSPDDKDSSGWIREGGKKHMNCTSPWTRIILCQGS